MEVGAVRWSQLLALGCLLAAIACGSDEENPGGSSGSGNFFNSGAAGDGSSLPTTGPVPGACADGSAQASRVVPSVMLVLDGSCSMTTDYPSSGGQSLTRCEDNPNGRWAALRRALVDPSMGIVPRLQSAVAFGVAVYGTAPTCPIPGQVVAPARDNLAAVEGAMPGVQPGMYTPTGIALDQVYDQVLSGLASAPDREGPVLVVLATDGEPNSCDNATPNYQPSIDAVTRLAGAGIKTYVVSLAAAAGEFHDHLQQLADLGAGVTGAPLYEPNSPEQLAADLELLIGGAVGCDVALNGTIEPGGECQGSVALNGEALACNDGDGYVLADPRHIRLQGAACDTFMSAGNAMVTVRFPCNLFRPD